MKNIILILILFSVVAFSNAQIVTIPDANFKAKLIQIGVDTNNDGEIQIEEAENTTSLNITSGQISDVTGIEAFVNLEYLYCGTNPLYSLDLSSNTQLVHLDTWTIPISSIDISMLSNLEIFKSNNASLYEIDFSQNTSLVILELRNIDIISYDFSNNINLENLRIRDTPIDVLDLSANVNLNELRLLHLDYLNVLDLSNNSNLTTLDLLNIPLTEIDVTQCDLLTYFDCTETLITEVDVSQNIVLEDLILSDNQISTINVSQNTNLQTLLCDNNQITSLIIGQNTNLSNLECQNNQLTNLNISQLPNLWNMDCSFNNLTDLDITQNNSLSSLYFNDNLIDSIDFSNNNELYFIIGNNNALEELDLSETNVFSWNFSNNQLSYINIKNGVNDNGNGVFENNPVEFICSDPDEVGIYQNSTNFQIPISDYCSFEPGGEYNTISGTIIFDFNNNGCDVNDTLYPGMGIDIFDGTDSGMTFSNHSGEYTFYTEVGTYEIMPNFENPSWFNVSPSTILIPFSDLNNTVTQDFCITPNGTHNDLEIVISPTVPAQPGFDAVYQIVYKNKGNQVLSGAIDLSYDGSVLDFVSSTLAPDAQSAGILTWNYTDLNPFESRTIELVLNVNSPMETPPVNNDDILTFTATASPVSGDETPTDNTFDLNQIVVGSYDPNDITCLEGDVVSPERIGEYLHYNIRFENTGTAPATFIVVKDLIDQTKYDLSTLQILSASHNMVTRVEGNQVEFFFEAINLAPLAQGNVLFKIKSLNTLVTGDSVSQEAEIYFDYNFPIITNIALTTFENLSVENPETDNLVSVYPNPTSGLLTINSRSTIKTLELFDIQGRQVQSFSISEANTIDISNVSKGVYFLDIKTNSGTAVKKIIKD